MSNVLSLVSQFTSFIAGNRLVDGGQLLQLAQYTLGAKSGLTALAGGGAAGATPLVYGLNEVAIAASANDSVLLPLAIPGASVTLINDGAQSCRAWPAQGNPNNNSAADTVSAHATNVYGTYGDTGSGYVSEFSCAVLGQWKQLLSA